MDPFKSETGPRPLWIIDPSRPPEDAPIIGGPGVSTRGKRVWFRTIDGHSSYVEVPLSDFTAEVVKRMIDAAVRALYAVSALEGEPVSPEGF